MSNVKATCHPDKEHVARGLCKTCYAREHARRARQDPDLRARMNANQRAWAKAHPDRERERSRRRRKDPEYNEYHRRTHRAWLRKNPELNAEYKRRAKARNPEHYAAKVREYVKKRKSRKKGAAVCDFTAQQWAQMKIDYDNCCFYCTEPCDALTQDHMTPLSKGGDHTASNIVPSCVSCNCRKGARTAEEFLAA